MLYLLDTNVAIALRDGDAETVERVGALGDDLGISVVTRIELEAGLLASVPDAAPRRRRLEAILEAFTVAPLDAAAVAAYADIIAATGFSRRKILDRMIAAQAVALGATLVTRNGSDFEDVPGLRLLAW